MRNKVPWFTEEEAQRLRTVIVLAAAGFVLIIILYGS